MNKRTCSVSRQQGLAGFPFAFYLSDLGTEAEGEEHNFLEFKKEHA